MHKLVAALIAATFSLGAFAQATPAMPAAPAASAAKAEPAKKPVVKKATKAKAKVEKKAA